MAYDYEKPKWDIVGNTYNLRLGNTGNINYQNIEELFQKVIESNCEGNKISKTFVVLFQKWLNNPELPLREETYVILSNCFLTENPEVAASSLAINTERLWKNLFCSKPTQGLSYPKGDKHDKILPESFSLWWQRQLECQKKF